LRAVHGVWVNPYLGFVKKFIAEGLRSDAHLTDVYPREIGAFELAHMPLGQIFLDEIAQKLIITIEILVKCIYPILAVVIGCLEGYGAERIQVAHLIDIDSTIQSTAPFWLRADDVGSLQSSNIKRLSRIASRISSRGFFVSIKTVINLSPSFYLNI